MPALTSEPTPESSLEEVVLEHAEQLEWLLRPMYGGRAEAGPFGGLVFHKFQSMNQTWSRAGA